jgi:tetratricopeptide (TPR) repeat protein
LTGLFAGGYLFIMPKSILAFLIGLSLVSATLAQQAKPQPKKPEQPAAVAEAGFIPPSDVNVRIEPDVRTLVVMAAINVAGFDYEAQGQPLSPARAELRKDLANLNPQIKQELAEFYKAHRRPDVDEAVDAQRYAALSLLMTAPPAFSIYTRDDNNDGKPENIPDDLQPLIKDGFVRLVSRFYTSSGIKELLPKYVKVGQVYSTAYRRPVGEMIYKTLEYFHTKPETIVNMRPLVVETKDPQGGNKRETQRMISRTRTRQVFVIPDPFAALEASVIRDDILNQKEDILSRRVGDDYTLIIGPSNTPNRAAIRATLIRFVVDPMIERHLKASLEYRDQILDLMGSVPTAVKYLGPSVYLVLRQSLAGAAEARMRRIQSAETGVPYSEDDAVYDLAQSYLRGAVLAFHFYDSLKGFEQVGINIEDFFDQMVATTKFDREAARAREFEPIVARVSAARKSASARAPREADPGAAMNKILLLDDLIRQRRFDEARPILEEIFAAQPNNARVLYGLAQIKSQVPTAVENDANADENDKIQAQHDRLEAAMKLYRKAIENASKDSERWLVQWSYVSIARILDFQEFRADALAEYEKAIALGDVPNGAYKEALEGKQRPFGQK